MHKMTIDKLGPIGHAELIDNKYMVFIGSQASGKSTIAKAMYFFRTIKDDILLMMIKKSTGSTVDVDTNEKFLTSVNRLLREKFLGIFGSSRAMDKYMQLEYRYNEATYIKIALDKDSKYNNPNFVLFEYSQNIVEYFMQNDDILDRYTAGISDSEITSAKEELESLFNDKHEIVYIPAGRSMITLLATQLNYIYSTMDDVQKRTIDLCTRSYLENIIKQRPLFSNGLNGLENDNPIKARNNKDNLLKAKKLIRSILKGGYRFYNGEDRLDINSNRYVKINFASSGQQEAVWIVNLLFYYLVQGCPSFFIIEEPESHLFPEAQKQIVELISIVRNAGHCILVTTHSPYVLGSINNLLYASQLPEKCIKSASRVLDCALWLRKSDVSGWFIQDGIIADCVDSETGLIQNELIDDISNVINDDFDKLLSINTDVEEAGE